MTESKCYLCDSEITKDNISFEHIIPNSIGGRLKSKSLICNICNITTGQLFDAEFSKVGNIFASKYDIKKEKGVVQSIQAIDLESGKRLIIDPGYEIKYADPQSYVDDKVISVNHWDKTRAIEEIKRLSKLFSAKINDADIKFELVEDESRKVFQIDFLIEPSLLLRSVCKTIVNFYIYKTNDREGCLPVINFLKKEIKNTFCWFLDLDLCNEIHSGKPYHILTITGDIKSKVLYAYFEVFGEVGFVVFLNGKYSGPSLQLQYTFDPINAIEIHQTYDLNIPVGSMIDHLIAQPEPRLVKCIHY